jgi:plasmid stabilization system protein ParE
MAHGVMMTPALVIDEQVVLKGKTARAAAIVDHPRMGRVVPEIGDESVREIMRGNYRIQYRVTEEVHVVAVVEGHQEVSAE